MTRIGPRGLRVLILVYSRSAIVIGRCPIPEDDRLGHGLNIPQKEIDADQRSKFRPVLGVELLAGPGLCEEEAEVALIEDLPIERLDEIRPSTAVGLPPRSPERPNRHRFRDRL